MKLLFAGEIVTSKLSICRATLNIVHISKTVRCSFSWLIKAATNAPRINLIGYVCCLKWQKSSVQYWTFVCRETLQKNKFWLHHLIIRSQALGRLRPGFRFYWNSSVSHNQESPVIFNLQTDFMFYHEATVCWWNRDIEIVNLPCNVKHCPH